MPDTVLAAFRKKMELRYLKFAIPLVVFCAFVYYIYPLAPYLKLDFHKGLIGSDEILVKPQISTGVPDWDVVQGSDNLARNSACSGREDYDVNSTFIEWPQGMKPPDFYGSWYTPDRYEEYYFLVQGDVVGCKEFYQTYFPVFRAKVWTTTDKKVFAFTRAGRVPVCLFLSLGILLGLIGLRRMLGGPLRTPDK